MKDKTYENTSKWLSWCNEARRASLEIWGYEGLIDDNPEDALNAFVYGVDPRTYVLGTGEDLDLIKATKYWMGPYGI